MKKEYDLKKLKKRPGPVNVVPEAAEMVIHIRQRNRFFEDLNKGLQTAIEYEGGKLDLRTTEFEIPELPPTLSKSKRLAKKLLE